MFLNGCRKKDPLSLSRLRPLHIRPRKRRKIRSPWRLLPFLPIPDALKFYGQEMAYGIPGESSNTRHRRRTERAFSTTPAKSSTGSRRPGYGNRAKRRAQGRSAQSRGARASVLRGPWVGASRRGVIQNRIDFTPAQRAYYRPPSLSFSLRVLAHTKRAC